MRRYGLACDNLIGADVVTADGRLVHVGPNENPELLWGLRGGGGNFGIVTQFEFELHPLGPLVYGGPIIYPAEHAAGLIHLFREWAPNAPDDVTAVINLTTAPPLPVIPQDWHGRKVALFMAMSAGTLDAGPQLVHEIRSYTEPVADLLGPIPYTALQSMIDPLWPKGIHSYFKATNLAKLDDQLIDRLCEFHQQAPGPRCEIHIHQMGGAFGRVAEHATAFPERSIPFLLNTVTGWHDPTETDAHVGWARRVIASAEHASTGRTYVNYLGDAADAHSSYGAETHARLVVLKNEYDPTNVFQLNQNIAPTAAV
jgi:FAD/FMN-containing dehydrogenase